MIFKKDLPVACIKKHLKFHCWLFIFFAATMFVFFLISCTPTKKILYFENLPNDTLLHNLVTKDFELKIRKGDIINIGVSGLSTEASAVFTPPAVTSGSTTASGFLVDVNGNILYPKLGILHVEGLTRDELKNRLLKDLVPYLKEPLVTVNFVNHKIVVIGEVNKVLPMPDETMTILEAISVGGGIPATARKDNILVIRGSEGDKQFKRLNLNNSSIFYSPFYYLRPDDIVYVEPVKNKGATNTQQIVGYITTGLSFIFLILSWIK